MPTFRATRKIIIPSRKYRFLRFLEGFITPIPSRQKAGLKWQEFFNPSIKRTGFIGYANEFLNPRSRRYGFWNILANFVNPEPPRTGPWAVVTAFLDAPVYRLQQGGRDITRPREREATFFQRFISGINEFLNAYTHFADLFASPYILKEVPSSSFDAALEKLIYKSKLSIELMLKELYTGQITPQQFAAGMYDAVKRINLTAALLGIKGLGNVTPDALTAIVNRTDAELSRLRLFLADSFGPNFEMTLGMGKLSTKQFQSIAIQFASAGRASSTVAQQEMMLSLYGAGMEIGGNLYHRRVTQKDGRSCDDCIAWASAGWVRTDGGNELPPPGTQCVCESNCRCYYEFCLATTPGDCQEEPS